MKNDAVWYGPLVAVQTEYTADTMFPSRDAPDADLRAPAHLEYRARHVVDGRRAWTRADEYSSCLSLFLLAAFALGPAVIVGAALGVHWLKTAVTIAAACAGVALYAGLRHRMWRVAVGLLAGTFVTGALLGATALLLFGVH